MIRTRVAALCAVIAAAAIVAGCGSSKSTGGSGGNTTAAEKPAAATKAPLEVPVLGTDSGPFKELGASQNHGVKLAISEINAAGGVDGRKLVPVFADDAGEPTQAVSQTRSLLQRLKPPVFFGASFGTTSDAIESIVNQEKVILFPGSGAASTIDASKYPYAFRAYLTEVSQGAALVSYVKAHKIGNVAVFSETSEYGDASKAEALRRLSSSKVTVSVSESFAPGTSDFTPLALKAKSAKPELVYFISSAIGDFANFAQAEQSIGLTTRMLGAPAIVSPLYKELAKGAGSDALGQVYKTLTYTSSGPEDPEIVPFIKKIDALGGKSDLIIADMYWYDMVHLWADAANQAKSVEPDAVKSALEGIRNYKGIQGTFNFSPTEHDGLALDSLVTAEVSGESLNSDGLWRLAE